MSRVVLDYLGVPGLVGLIEDGPARWVARTGKTDTTILRRPTGP